MKIKISESKIRQTVNEELFKRKLTKTIKESTWPNYVSYLVAEVLQLEWQQKLQENNNLNQQPSPEWIAETASAFGLSEAEIAEATELMKSEQLEEGGIKGFMKAFAKPYVNLYKTFSNITQHAANATDPDKDPEAAQDAEELGQVVDQAPSPEEVVQTAKQSPEELGAMIKELIALLRAADSKIDMDNFQPGLEDKIDQAQGAVEQGAEQGIEDLGAAGGAEGAEGAAGGGEAFVYRGKGGKGLQSFLARGSKQAPKLKGKAMGAVLKHIEKQLKAQGVTVNEGVLDDVQGWIWYGLVENKIQEHYGAPITIQEIINASMPLKEWRGIATQKKIDGQWVDMYVDTRGEILSDEGVAFAKKEKEKLEAKGDTASLKVVDRLLAATESKRPGSTTGEGAAEEPAAEEPAAEEPAAEEAPIEEVPPTVQNTAPEGSPKIKVFRGKGGEGLQSALAKNRDALGIDQQTVAVIIKSVEQWAQANQIQVENVTADTFDSIINEIVPKFRARKLQEAINKLKNV